MSKTRAYGADCVLLAAFETAYGTPPANGYTRLSFKDSTLGAERPLGYDPLLGQGRDAQGETEAAQTIDAASATLALKRFSQGSGTIKVAGTQLANNLERVETIRSDGLIDGVDETEATAEGSIDVRFSTDTTLTAAIAAESPVELAYDFTIPGTGFALTFDLPRVFCPKKKQEVKGPGGIQASYDWRAARDPTAGYLLRVTLVNDVAAY